MQTDFISKPLAPNPGPKAIFFRSGCSSLKDFMAAMEARVPSGISVGKASENVLGLADEYLASAGMLLADSGAFSAFRHGKLMEEADFEHHLDVCDRLAGPAVPGHLFIVAPDIIGDQDATIQLFKRFAPRLISLGLAGAVIVVPLQRGQRSLCELFKYAQDLLAPHEICAGLPSNAAALSSDEIIEFLRHAKAPMVHFLGAARNKRFQGLLAEASSLAPTTRFSYDATVLRAICGEIGSSPAKIEESASIALLSNSIDLTEIDLMSDPIALQIAAELINVSTDELSSHLAITEGSLDDDSFISNMLLGYWSDFAVAYAQYLTKAEWRTKTLAAHPSFSTDPHNAQTVMVL